MRLRAGAGLFALLPLVVAVGAALVGCRTSVVPASVPAASASIDNLEHQFPELERLLPATMAGLPAIGRTSFDGEAAADDESLYFGIYARLIEAVGAEDAARIHIAEETWPLTREGWLTLRVFRLDTREDLWPSVTDAALSAPESDLSRWQRATVGGREVLSALDLAPNDQAIYVLRRGDVAYEIESSDRARAEAMVAALP
jgi:hypothetical protein